MHSAHAVVRQRRDFFFFPKSKPLHGSMLRSLQLQPVKSNKTGAKTETEATKDHSS